MKCSLITTVFNESASIASFINSLNNQTTLPDEIVIVDGGSTDDTVAIIRKTITCNVPLKLVVDVSCNKKHSIAPIAKGRNVAIDVASFEYILITDAGCVLDKSWVSEMKNGFAAGFDVVAGNYKAQTGNKFQTYLADVFCPNIVVTDPKKFLPSSRSLGIRKDIWRRVGGYPLNSYTAEDTKFALLMYEITDKICFAEKAIVYWELPKNFGELWRKTFNYGVGDGIQRVFLHRYLFRAITIVFPFPFLLMVVLGKKKLIGYPMYLAQVYGFLMGFLGRQ